MSFIFSHRLWCEITSGHLLLITIHRFLFTKV
jgi:hypothetical protein